MDPQLYWQLRARTHGKRAVLNLSHSDDEYDQVTEWQKQLLFPILSRNLNGSERTLLDFGCGPGRFTPDLAALVGGTAVGVDISAELIKLAAPASNVRYYVGSDRMLLDQNLTFDVVWVCLVMGGVSETRIGATVEALKGCLNPGGLLFLVENTAKKPNAEYWFFRSAREYIGKFDSVDLSVAGTYQDMGE
jgi:SAM-dependent methyltransferase